MSHFETIGKFLTESLTFSSYGRWFFFSSYLCWHADDVLFFLINFNYLLSKTNGLTVNIVPSNGVVSTKNMDRDRVNGCVYDSKPSVATLINAHQQFDVNEKGRKVNILFYECSMYALEMLRLCKSKYLKW